MPTEMTLGDYLDVVRRRKWWIALAALSFLIALTVFAHRMPDIYRAETVILVDSSQVPDKIVATINTGDIAGRLTTLEQQVLSPTRLKTLVESEGLYPDPTGKRAEEEIVKGVQKSIVVEGVNPGGGKMGEFRIAYSSRNRLEVAKVANRIAQMFIEENLRARVDQTQDTAQFLQDRLQDTKRQLDEKDAQLRSIKSRNIMEMPESKPYHMEALANLRTQAQAIQEKIQQDQRDKSMLQSLILSGQQEPTVEVDSATPGGSAEGVYQAEIQKLETKLMQLRTRYGPSHPDVRKAQDEIDRLKARAASEQQNDPAVVVEPPAKNAPGQKRRNPVLEAQIDKLNEEIQQQTRLLGPIQAQMKYHESKLEQIPVWEQQIARLQADYDLLKTQYTNLLDKEKAAELSHALEVHQKGEKFEVLDYASTPTKPAAPNRLLISIAGLFGGLLAGIALAVLKEMQDESVRSEGEAARILGKPVLSGIPQITSRRERLANRWRAACVLAGTVAASVAVGLLLSFVSGRFF
ncbi:MAG TPA: GNVR domain-containing protein [Methylomirabilota bacterium]|nr:GNVR domain-containing protein [Methylomirabilota bacterium]